MQDYLTTQINIGIALCQIIGFFLKHEERYANDLLKLRGTIFLNDVYEMLGFERTKAGQVVGWHYSKDNPIGDNEVIFGVQGSYNSIAIDFNVDGIVINYLKD